jgi:hypothetical protein
MDSKEIWKMTLLDSISWRLQVRSVYDHGTSAPESRLTQCRLALVVCTDQGVGVFCGSGSECLNCDKLRVRSLHWQQLEGLSRTSLHVQVHGHMDLWRCIAHNRPKAVERYRRVFYRRSPYSGRKGHLRSPGTGWPTDLTYVAIIAARKGTIRSTPFPAV